MYDLHAYVKYEINNIHKLFRESRIFGETQIPFHVANGNEEGNPNTLVSRAKHFDSICSSIKYLTLFEFL